MAPQKGLHIYQVNDISTSSQGRLILMLYDGALQAVDRARQCMVQEDVAGRSAHILKTQDIINELLRALDLERGGEVSKTLEQLYQFILNQLIQANLTADTAYLDSVVKVLSILREGWSRIVEVGVQEPQPTESSSPEPFATQC